MDQLERAVRDGRRIAIMRRGTEYLVIATGPVNDAGHDAVEGRLPMTGEILRFRLTEIEHFELVGS